MIIKDIEFKLKDGRTAILRSANEKDAEALIEYMKKSTGETDFFSGHYDIGIFQFLVKLYCV